MIVDFGPASIQTNTSEDFSFDIVPASHLTIPYTFNVDTAKLSNSTVIDHRKALSLSKMSTRSSSRQSPPLLDPIAEEPSFSDEYVNLPQPISPDKHSPFPQAAPISHPQPVLPAQIPHLIPSDESDSSHTSSIPNIDDDPLPSLLPVYDSDSSDDESCPSLTHLVDDYDSSDDESSIASSQEDLPAASTPDLPTTSHDPAQTLLDFLHFYDETDPEASPVDDEMAPSSFPEDDMLPSSHKTLHFDFHDNHPCNVLKYLDGQNDDNSHKGHYQEDVSNLDSDNVPSPVAPAMAPTSPSIPTHKKSYLDHLHRIISDLQKALLSIKRSAPSQPNYGNSEFKSLISSRLTPSISPQENAVLSLIAESKLRQKQALEETFPSDPSVSQAQAVSTEEALLDFSTTSPHASVHAVPLTSIPPLRPIDKVNSTIPQSITFTSEHLQKCTGFRNISSILPQIKTVAADTVTFSDLGRDPLKQRGEVATMPKKRRNTKPVPRPAAFGDVFHFDIGYSAGTAIGGIRYALFFVDRKNRQKYIYPLKDLDENSILEQVKFFIRDIGRFPRYLLADRDQKLLGGAIERYLADKTILAGAPRKRQNQNGLSEANWRFICDIARNYLAENLLPNKFWYFALAYAIQVTNYLPVKTSSKSFTSPHFATYGIKPDYRKLIPLFSTAYVKEIYRDDVENKFKTQTIKAILVGNDLKSNGQLFFNPASNRVIASVDYSLDPTHPSGPLFNFLYDGGLQFMLYEPSSVWSRPSTFNLEATVKISDTFSDSTFHNEHAIVTHLPSTGSPSYTVLHKPSNSFIEILEKDLTPIEVKLESLPATNPFLTFPWIQPNTKATLFLDDKQWKLPKQGFLTLEDDEWYFQPGRSISPSKYNQPVHLPHFKSTAPDLIHSCRLAEGWVTHSHFIERFNTAQSQTYLLRRMVLFQTTDISDTSYLPPLRLRKISARTLQSHHPPPNLKAHSRLSPNDREIWDSAYLEEYLGLNDTTHTWDYISEDEYQTLKSEIGKAVPTMVVSKIKYDQHGNPDRAKYRIVVLGNLDPTNWSAADCFAPVLSALENRLLTCIAAQMKVIPKSGDFIQAFCQSHLPDNEKYICKPPPGCPITPPKLPRLTLHPQKGCVRQRNNHNVSRSRNHGSTYRSQNELLYKFQTNTLSFWSSCRFHS